MGKSLGRLLQALSVCLSRLFINTGKNIFKGFQGSFTGNPDFCPEMPYI